MKHRFLGLLMVVFIVALTFSGASAAEDYPGDYFLPSGARLSVVKEGAVAEMAQLVMINWTTGRVGRLDADGTDRFVIPSLNPENGDNATTVTFVRGADGGITHMLVAAGKLEPERADRGVTFTKELVTFVNGDVTLSGTLELPIGSGPFPAVVLIHGSGPGGREQVESMARFFCQIGLAALSYDKRGCGESTGDWKTVGFGVLADDAIAGVEYLRSRADIDPARVGVWGISQGGWIGPLAASKSSDVTFVINHSGPGTTPRRQDTYMMSRVLAMQDVPKADVDLAVAALNTLYDYGQSKATAAALDEAVEKTRGKPGLEDFDGMSSRNVVPDSMYAQQAIGDPAWFFHIDPDHDALEPYRTLRCPLLVVYGRLDFTVPVDESVAAISGALEESGHPDWLVKVLERTGHGMLVMDPAAPHRPAIPLTQASEYFDLMKSWLSERGF
jgi:pimeloyl-ACP methyl ester carboxylesterase